MAFELQLCAKRDVLQAGRTIRPMDCVDWERLLTGPLGALSLYFFICRFVDCAEF